MALRLTFLSALILLLSACNVTLAEDITPPPNYIPPAPVPTLVLYPAKAPNVANGAEIYFEKCAACHGLTGLGDGEQGIQLSVTVRAFGLAEIARPASPAQYYTMVTRGNIERFMPPFASLTDQERWDVTAFVLTLHTTPKQVERGKELFELNCANCSTDFFEDQQIMSTLTAVELARIIKQGNDQVEAFGADFTDEDLWSTAAYLRTLSFDSSPLATPEPVAAVATPASSSATPASAVETPVEASTAVPALEAQPGFGNVSGSIENKTGQKLPADLLVTLKGFEHDLADPSAGPVEVYSADASVNSDGTYSFENIELPANRIFVASVPFDGITLQSDFAIVEEGVQSIEIPSLTLHRITDELSGLVMDGVQVIFEYGPDSISVYSLYSFRNPTEEIVVIPQDETGQIPFIKLPEGSVGFGLERTGDSAPFISTESGFAIPPSENSYGLVAFSTLPSSKAVNFSQAFVLPVATINIFTPVGVDIEGADVVDLGVQTIQGFDYQIYEGGAIVAGESLQFTLSGIPQDVTTTPSGGNTALFIGAAAVGLALVLAGLWMYRQDKRKVEDDVDEEGGEEFDSAEDVMDAIIALDDLHGRKKINETAYQKRRADLKEILKEMM